jgi:5,10-methylenetetrahydromethanopterin reductase
MANLAATLQSLSGGRIELGIGRGDSALAHLGRAPVPLKVLESYVGVVKDHLRSIDVPFEAISRFNSDGAPQASDILEMSDTPQVSRLEWIDHGQPPVPIDVVASGPRTIAVGGRVGDSVSLTVGADRARIEWGMSIARSARESVRLDPSTLPIGVYLNVVAHPDRDVAHRLARANIAGVARFSVMQGAAAGPVTPVEAVVLSKLRHAYDMNDHGKITAGHGTVITEEFADNYGVVGGPEHCVDRIASLMDLGVSKFVLMPARPRIPAHLETDPDVRVSNQCLVDQVLPALLSMFATDRSGSTE